MITWKDIIAAPDKSMESWANIDDFTLLFGLSVYISNDEDFESRVKKYWLPGYTWICTDERVGLAFYTLDDEIVAVSSQTGRKNDEIINFISQQSADKMYNVILDLMRKNQQVSFIANLDERVDEWRRTVRSEP